MEIAVQKKDKLNISLFKDYVHCRLTAELLQTQYLSGQRAADRMLGDIGRCDSSDYAQGNKGPNLRLVGYYHPIAEFEQYE